MFSYLNAPPALNPSSQWAYNIAPNQASFYNDAPPSRNSGYNAPTRSSVYDNSHNATYFNGPNPAQNLTPGHNMAPNQALFYNIAPQRLPFETLDPLPRHVAFKF